MDEPTFHEKAIDRLDQGAKEADEADEARKARYKREDDARAAQRAEDERLAEQGRKDRQVMREQLVAANDASKNTFEKRTWDVEARLAALEAKLDPHGEPEHEPTPMLTHEPAVEHHEG